MTVDVSYFSLASILALIVFLAIIIPRAFWHAGRLVLAAARGRREPVDGWLIAIAISVLICVGLGVATQVYAAKVQGLLDASASVTLSFLLFAMPALLQVLRAWTGKHARQVRALSHALVALTVLSLPASMAIPTAALLQSTSGQTGGAPAALFADERFFTDSELANDPEDYPAAAFLNEHFTWRRTVQTRPAGRRVSFYRQVPTFTAFWFDQTTDVLSFEASDIFGILISPIAHVRANLGFSLAVFLYKLLCAVVLVAVTFDPILSPLVERARQFSRRRRRARVDAAAGTSP